MTDFLIGASLSASLAAVASLLWAVIPYFRDLRRKSMGGRRVLIYGAGMTGQLALEEVKHYRSRENSFVVGFIDDDPKLRRSVVNGIRVLGSGDEIQQFVVAKGVEEIIWHSTVGAPR